MFWFMFSEQWKIVFQNPFQNIHFPFQLLKFLLQRIIQEKVKNFKKSTTTTTAHSKSNFAKELKQKLLKGKERKKK